MQMLQMQMFGNCCSQVPCCNNVVEETWYEQSNSGGCVIEPLPPYLKSHPSLQELVAALKACGGVKNAPGAKANHRFLNILRSALPELAVYCTGKIQTSPGVEEIEGSPTEYYRTVGAIIAVLACYAQSHGDNFGLEAVSAGERGPMSLEKVPGKFVNIGAKPEEYEKFCGTLARYLRTEEDWWFMVVYLTVHDIGKSDMFRNAVNANLPKHRRSDNHDRALGRALEDPDLVSRLMPSVGKLSPHRVQQLAIAFNTHFQLPQLGQGETSATSLRGLLDLPKERLEDGTLQCYFYHSIFDIAGNPSNEKCIYPLALIPVYTGFSTAMEELTFKLQTTTKQDPKDLYFNFLYTNFKKAYPEFEMMTFEPLCESQVFRSEVGLVVLRVLALTRNTYKNPAAVLAALQSEYSTLVQEMSEYPSGPQIMLYYAPDMLRMSLGDDLEDTSGENIRFGLSALEDLYQMARKVVAQKALTSVSNTGYQYELNVQPAVTAIKNAGKDWVGCKQLQELCNEATVSSNELLTEGILIFQDANLVPEPTYKTFVKASENGSSHESN